MPQKGTDVMANDRDPRNDLGAWLGEELHRARVAVGYSSQDRLARELGFDRTVIAKAETGARPPSEDVAARLAELFPGLCNGLYVQLAGVARRTVAPVPGWFTDWLAREGEATSIRIWQPIIIPGLLQTADYARALYVGGRASMTDDALEELVAARLTRQAVLDKPDPPHIWMVLDEPVLHRFIGTPKTMHDQLLHLADMAERPYVSIQVVPASVGAHAGLTCAFMIGSADSAPDLLLVEAIEDHTIRDSEVVQKAAVAFDLVRGDALPRGASRDLILKVAEERWNA
jgi:transcriptional regulator with XRE-family HTH domain